MIHIEWLWKELFPCNNGIDSRVKLSWDDAFWGSCVIPVGGGQNAPTVSPACCMRDQHGIGPDGSACTAWDYAGLLWNLNNLALERPWKSDQNAATILKPLVPNHLPTHVVPHLADWVALFSRSQYPYSPPLKFHDTHHQHTLKKITVRLRIRL